ncbi:MAG: ABC transporter ATP-binding protein [Meiothermus sp.]|nr:ABC transporter ATP-binding protein [Meiothermus sp.]
MAIQSYGRLLATYLRPHRPKVALLAVCLLGSIGMQLLTPQIVRQFIDAAGAGTPLETLTRLALLFLGAALLNQLLSAASTYLSADVGWSSTNALRVDLFRHALRLDMAYHKARTPGEMIERIDGDVTHIANFFAQFLVRVGGALLLVLGILVLLWLESPAVGATLTAYVAVVIWVLNNRREVAVPATKLERQANAEAFGFIEERLSGLDDIRANGAGRYVMHRFREVQRSWYFTALKAWLLRSSIWVYTLSLFAVGYVLMFAFGINLFAAGGITLGTAYLFFNYMSMLEGPLEQITQQLQEFQQAGAGMQRVTELQNERREVPDGSRSLGGGAHAVELRKVRFAYEDQDVLKGLSFRLEPGQSMGLLGRTGSGKTTLIRLLFRLYDATEGAVLLDGVDLRELRLEDLRRRVGLVTQDVQLFHGTLRENLTFFDPGVAEERLWAVLDELGLRGWVEGLPQGLDTPLQAGGGGLSAGEAQLLAFARVFLQEPGLVILDEPSSRLDPATERLLNDAIARLLEGRTAILIAHRLETVERVDKIMVLKDGETLEWGDRAALAANPDSRYAQLRALSTDAGLDEGMERAGL